MTDLGRTPSAPDPVKVRFTLLDQHRAEPTTKNRRRFMPLIQMFVDAIRERRREPADSGQPSHDNRPIRLAERAAKSSIPVLIEAEPGSGADALARAIHDCSDRKNRPFVRIHAGSRADESLPGKASEAQGGTLLIQDVEALSLDDQAVLLRLIQDGEVESSGSRRTLRVDARVIVTTAANLMDGVRHGRFREDLYYRLHVLPISLQPLRARRDEIPNLAMRFAGHFAAQEGKPIADLTPEAAACLTRYDWPGNLRQLENATFRAVVLAEGEALTVAEFPQIAAQVEGFRVEIPALPATAACAPVRDIVRIEVRDPHALSLTDDEGEIRSLDELEADIIRFALDHYRGHMSAVSRRLGIGRSTLYRKLKDLGLENAAADAAA